MANARVVVTEANDATPAVGGIFAGISFFVLQRVPQRASFVERIQANGGRVVKVEEQADHVIADHYRPDCPTGSVSYTFIEAALREGTLPNPTNHTAGPPPGTIRPAGSAVPGRNTRTPFTVEDDRQLWLWVERYKQNGGRYKGNDIYKQLEAVNGRHTYQAWRDRYLKKLMGHPPAGVKLTVSANAPPSPPTVQDAQAEIIASAESPPQRPEVQEQTQTVNDNSVEDDIEVLLLHGDDIEDVAEERTMEAWEAWSEDLPRHSAAAWQRIWEQTARPEYLKRKTQAEASQQPNVDGVEGTADANPTTDEPERSLRQSSARKRKRNTPTASAKMAYGRKKQRVEGLEIFNDADDNNNSPIRRENAGRRSKQAATTRAREDEQAKVTTLVPNGEIPLEPSYPTGRTNDVVPTSELNREAQAQFDEEVLGIRRPVLDASVSEVAILPTSEVNRAADEQLPRESVGREPEAERNNEQVPSSSQAQIPDILAADEGSPPDLSSVPIGDALTEANLASQQAEQQGRILRGTDLQVDDDVRDGDKQDQYATYLQDLMRQSGQYLPAAVTGTRIQQDQVDIEKDLPSHTFAAAPNELNTAVTAHLPLSSQQEIDDTLDAMINWPESPKQSQKKAAPRTATNGSQFDTQVGYPSLPTTRLTGEPTDRFPAVQEEPYYPQLPQNKASARINDEASESSSESCRRSPSADLDSSYVFVGKSGDIEPRADPADDDDDMDMSVPMPEGGFQTSSSPAKTTNSQPLQAQATIIRRTTVTHGQDRISSDEVDADEVDADEVDADEDGRKVTGPMETIELSSETSSSSSSSSDDDARPAAAQRRALETQDIVNAETQVLDFDMPLPPDSDNPSNAPSSDDYEPPSSPPVNDAATQRNLTQTQKLPDEDVDEWIETMILRHAVPVKSVVDALKCTSMRPELAEFVLLEEKLGKGLPRDVPGIWSAEEDRMLEGGNAKRLRELEDKHSWTECEERLLFLTEYRDEDEDE